MLTVSCCPFQLEINKKRDAELAKLRKLLEDVHLESEETAHMLRKKHQEAIVDLQDQLELLAKAKAKYAPQCPAITAHNSIVTEHAISR